MISLLLRPLGHVPRGRVSYILRGGPLKSDPGESPRMDINTDRLILIVTGAHLKAEASDRPLAYHLRKKMTDWLASHGTPENPECPRVLVCSDVWYLNNEPLRAR